VAKGGDGCVVAILPAPRLPVPAEGLGCLRAWGPGGDERRAGGARGGWALRCDRWPDCLESLRAWGPGGEWRRAGGAGGAGRGPAARPMAGLPGMPEGRGPGRRRKAGRRCTWGGALRCDRWPDCLAA
jgi:hypothetical protein